MAAPITSVTARLASGRTVDATSFTDLLSTSGAQVTDVTLGTDGVQVTFDRPITDVEAAAVSRRIRSVDAADEAERARAEASVIPEDFNLGATPPQPRMRINRTDPLTLTGAWQRIDFNGDSARNVNTFPSMKAGPLKVTYGKTAKLLRFMETTDRNYDLQLSIRTTSASVLAVASLLTVKAQLRLVVPAPTPTYFPLPDTADPYVDLHAVNLTGVAQASFGLPIYANSLIRQYGLGIEMRLSSTLLAGVTLTAADLIVYGR